jgi:ribosomal protein S18 acetylase RimI-like enzyme
MTDERRHVELIAFSPERDLPRLHSWLQQPHVSRWWGDPAETLKEVAERPRGGGEALITAAGVPVGYVRWQVPAREELDAAGLYEVPDEVVDIDIAIGEVEQLGRGIGSAALAILRERLTREGVTMVMLATSVQNERAVRAYEKAGFTRRRQFIDTDGGAYELMAFEP